MGFAQSGPARPSGMPSDANVIAFGGRAEQALEAELPSYTPLAEGYFQQFAPTEKGIYILNREAPQDTRVSGPCNRLHST
jgi:hypothetical protein